MLFGLSINPIDFFGLFLLLTGFVIGLGAVTVIDIHGFLGMKSEYWTEATTRTHKVTKPMIWTGICLAIFGGLLFYRNETLSGIPLMHACIASILLLNGCFLSCSVSPYLIKREKEGKSHKILPPSWQKRIAISLIISDIGWWSALMLLVAYLLNS